MLYFKPFFQILLRNPYFRLISTNTQSSGASEPSKRSYILKILFLAIFIAVFCIYRPSYAGLFSFLDNLLGSSPENEEKQSPNLQTMAILEAISSPDTNYGRGGGDIAVVNQSALLSDSGPLGTIADIDENKPNQGQISLYVVRDGDSLSQIAEMFDISVNTIIWTNDIKRGDLIKPGQTLVILPISGLQHTIKKGDTLKGIAKKYDGDVDEIVEFNGIDPEAPLAVGETIVIPNGETSLPASSSSYSTRVKGTGGPSYIGYYLRPISGGRKSQGLHGYNGIDLADSCGTPVMASASGDVVISRNYGWNGGYGKYLVISHPNGTQTLYAHMTNAIVSTGWHVVQGQIIGYIGSTGRSTGCHLHFEVRGAETHFKFSNLLQS